MPSLRTEIHVALYKMYMWVSVFYIICSGMHQGSYLFQHRVLACLHAGLFEQPPYTVYPGWMPVFLCVTRSQSSSFCCGLKVR